MVVVKEGFCWPAFFLSLPWALWHRLWRTLAVLLAIVAGLEAALYFAGADGVAAFSARLAFSLIVGFGANDWRRSGLLRQGYRPLGVVAAAGRDVALRRFFDLNPDLAAGPRRVVGETAF